MSNTTVLTLLSRGKTWLMGPSSPKAAMTAVTASNSGTRAATSAPKAMTKTNSVTGTDNCSAR